MLVSGGGNVGSGASTSAVQTAAVARVAVTGGGDGGAGVRGDLGVVTGALSPVVLVLGFAVVRLAWAPQPTPSRPRTWRPNGDVLDLQLLLPSGLAAAPGPRLAQARRSRPRRRPGSSVRVGSVANGHYPGLQRTEPAGVVFSSVRNRVESSSVLDSSSGPWIRRERLRVGGSRCHHQDDDSGKTYSSLDHAASICEPPRRTGTEVCGFERDCGAIG